MIHRKLDNLGELEEMFSSYSRLYLYEKGQNRDSEFQSDYLLVHENGKKILHLGLVKSERPSCMARRLPEMRQRKMWRQTKG